MTRHGRQQDPIDLDEGRAEQDEQQGWKNEEHQRKKKLERNLGGDFLGAKLPLGPQLVGKDAQRVADARAETISLNQHGGEGVDLLHAGPECQVAQRLLP